MAKGMYEDTRNKPHYAEDLNVWTCSYQDTVLQGSNYVCET